MIKTMGIEIIATESLGVRGMCCLVTAGERQILIDPGIALGYRRHGLLPHPYQVKTGIKVRQEIIKAMKGATDIVFSHFHGDHIPLLQANPYQLSFEQLADRLQGLRIWAKSKEGLSSKMQGRALDLEELLGHTMKIAEGCQDGPLTFSGPVPHGLPGERFGTVMMTKIDTGKQVFVHASDIQLLDNGTIDKILQWQPDIVFVDGPPLYIQSFSGLQRKKAWENGLRLARNVEILIVDHHLLRSETGILWLRNMSRISGKKIYCAADFMNKPRLLLEAQRRKLYREIPVAENWHRDYEEGKISIR
ncbi:MAG: hypothetical protein J7J70_01240 [Deltaproteobacteria bacterium]|nr:hypothetical protein [Candidatus Tharpellaceae bacterium]